MKTNLLERTKNKQRLCLWVLNVLASTNINIKRVVFPLNKHNNNHS